jgi:hypothetical protein
MIPMLSCQAGLSHAYDALQGKSMSDIDKLFGAS